MYHDTVINSFETRNDLPAAGRAAVVELLNARLADATDLYTQTRYDLKLWITDPCGGATYLPR